MEFGDVTFWRPFNNRRCRQDIQRMGLEGKGSPVEYFMMQYAKSQPLLVSSALDGYAICISGF